LPDVPGCCSVRHVACSRRRVRPTRNQATRQMHASLRSSHPARANSAYSILSDYRGKPVVLISWLDWSPTCCDQLSPYESELEAFQQRGGSGLQGLSFPLLANFEPKGTVVAR
jgi:hypothetical protein